MSLRCITGGDCQSEWRTMRVEVCSKCAAVIYLPGSSEKASTASVSREQASEEMLAWALGQQGESALEYTDRMKQIARAAFDKHFTPYEYVFCFAHNRAAQDEQGCNMFCRSDCDTALARVYRLEE